MNTTESSGGDNVFIGVPSTYQDLYKSIIFLTTLYVVGDILCLRIFTLIPPLVGELLVGLLLGPEGLDFVPEPEFWVMLGTIGLMFMLLQAGLQMDVAMLHLVGPACALMAIVGTILPVSIGIAISFALGLELKSAIAAGCCFGPTSVGLALNVLAQCDALHRPVGQLILAAAIVDDMIALVILSQLQLLKDDANNLSILQVVAPVVSPIAWLLVGGAVALFVLPKYLYKTLDLWDYYASRWNKEDAQLNRISDFNRREFILLVGLLILLLPCTYYTQASSLLGAFLAGLSFCRSDALNDFYLVQFKRMSYWLIRIFFAATNGFQVPVRLLGDKIVWAKGLAYCLAFLGKIALGPLFTPNFYAQQPKFNDKHKRDCAVVSFMMAGEAGLALVLAVYSLTTKLVTQETYAAIILAILISTILSPLIVKLIVRKYPFKLAEEEGSLRSIYVSDPAVIRRLSIATTHRSERRRRSSTHGM